jgi:hypothetical protein
VTNMFIEPLLALLRSLCGRTKSRQRHSGRIIRVPTGNWTGFLPILIQLRNGLRESLCLRNLISFFVTCHFDHQTIRPDDFFFSIVRKKRCWKYTEAISDTWFKSKKKRLKRAIMKHLSTLPSQLWNES